GDDVAHRRAAVFGEVVDRGHGQRRHVVFWGDRGVYRDRNAVSRAVIRRQREGRQILAADDQRQAGCGQRGFARTVQRVFSRFGQVRGRRASPTRRASDLGDDVAHRRAAVFGEVVDRGHGQRRHVVFWGDRGVYRDRNAVSRAVIRRQREGR